ncbi:phosphatase PAP2 family protein [Hymenobacter sp. B81]|uniref:phosphatase PAP2 family protein n=1 Tax=Hymenobacter sp. B81 TaxID=3344878 RepID=UPI0037DD4CEC
MRCRPFSLLAFSLAAALPAHSQNPASSPYQTRFVVDAPIAAALIATNVVAVKAAQNKRDLTPEEVLRLRREDVNGFDRFAAGNYDLDAKKLSDYPFYGSFAAPLVLMTVDGDVRRKFGQVGVLYLQTMAVTGAAFTISTALVDRSRPLAYSSEPTVDDRGDNNARNSFFAGHTAATASATFFAAKVFHDFHPDSPARPFVWAGAAAVPAAVGYLRLKAGKHFLSDNLVGYAVGAASGILVPQLHKTAGRRGMSVTPLQGFNVNGYAYGGLRLSKQL